MLSLYPPIKPYAEHRLSVDPLHSLYVEESGNEKGIPIVFIHGGPGAGSSPDNRRFFDPTQFRIIVFDQRGCGQSSPHAELTDNTTQALVSDLEAIREHLNIEKWVLFGGSWGSTLALVYAQTHPDRVLHLVLRGVFLGRAEDISWFYGSEGAAKLFPDYWEELLEPLSTSERAEVLQSYYTRLTGKDELVRMGAAKAWSQWEARCSTLDPSAHVVDFFTQPHLALSLACIETHYFMHNSFLEPNQILKNVNRLTGIPGTLVHGRYDVICPLEGAYALHKAWKGSELQIIRDAGHAQYERGIINALIHTTNNVARYLKP